MIFFLATHPENSNLIVPDRCSTRDAQIRKDIVVGGIILAMSLESGFRTIRSQCRIYFLQLAWFCVGTSGWFQHDNRYVLSYLIGYGHTRILPNVYLGECLLLCCLIMDFKGDLGLNCRSVQFWRVDIDGRA